MGIAEITSKNRTYHERSNANSANQSKETEPNTNPEEDEIANSIDPDHEDWRLRKIKQLNDQLRVKGEGGTIVVTPGFLDLSDELREQILIAMKGEDQFTEDNDPWGEHDMGSVNIEGNTVLWKIDYYDLDMNYLSPEPADPDVTRRVLTIMLASEY